MKEVFVSGGDKDAVLRPSAEIRVHNAMHPCTSYAPPPQQRRTTMPVKIQNLTKSVLDAMRRLWIFLKGG
jgi:hypothetical protein